MKALNFGISPCPNDTFIFGAWVQDLISVAPLEAGFFFADVDMLNRAVEARQPDICKVSVNMLPRISTEYAALRCGGAVGRGVGPVVVSRERLEPKDLDVVSVAVPGIRTTASLLLGLTGLHRGDLVEMEYNDIVDGVKWGEAEAGVLIHERRFTFEQEGLYKVMDLGEWWEQDTGLPLPLGAIVVRRGLGPDVGLLIEEGIRRSLRHARMHPESVRELIDEYAYEMEPDVIDRHIETFVNDFSWELGQEGENAVRELVRKACRLRGLKMVEQVFISD